MSSYSRASRRSNRSNQPIVSASIPVQIAQNFNTDIVQPLLWNMQKSLEVVSHSLVVSLTVVSWAGTAYLHLVQFIIVLILRAIVWILSRSMSSQLSTLVGVTVCNFLVRYLFQGRLSRNSADSEDPRQISPLSIVRPSSQFEYDTFQLENGINVAYRLHHAVPVSSGSRSAVDLIIVSPFDVLTGLNVEHLCPLDTNYAILYLTNSFHSDMLEPSVSARQLLRVHTASVYNFVQMLLDFGNERVRVVHDAHSYTAIFQNRLPSVDILCEYYYPTDLVSHAVTLRSTGRWYSLSDKIARAMQASLLDIDYLPFLSNLLPLFVLPFALTPAFKAIGKSRQLNAVRQIESGLAYRPLDKLANEIRSLIFGHRYAEPDGSETTPIGSFVPPLTAEYIRPAFISPYDDIEERIPSPTPPIEEKEPHRRLFNVGSFTSWFHSPSKYESVDETNNETARDQLFSSPVRELK